MKSSVMGRRSKKIASMSRVEMFLFYLFFEVVKQD
jgi:hypothetical protein